VANGEDLEWLEFIATEWEAQTSDQQTQQQKIKKYLSVNHLI
jgi:hypothetical protein